MEKEFVILQEGLVDRTGRIYNRSELERAVLLRGEQGIMGELGQESFGLGLNVDKISHIVKNIRFEDGKMIGTVRSLKTPCGNIVHEMDAAKVKLRTAIRGIGEVNNDGTVQNYELISIDIVLDIDT